MSRRRANGCWLLLASLLIALLAPIASAHETRPAYLQLRQLDGERYEVLWKVPALGPDRRLALEPRFPVGTRVLAAPRVEFENNAFVQRWQIRHAGGLQGASLRIEGLESTQTDVLVRVEAIDGSSQTLRVQPQAPDFVIAAQSSAWDVAFTYLRLGFEHILGGIDHLLFVLALLLLVRAPRQLFWTITAFTLAHSITLAAASLGWVHVPPPPVEASIALSIVLVAYEILQSRAGKPGLGSRFPWLVAFAFGLLHGLGFAGALSEIGLPANAIPVALLCFNLGVECGQLAFIAGVFALVAAARRLPLPPPRWRPGTALPAYAIGAVATCWTMERIAAFWS